ncbi:MAG: hypothetical protein QXX68_01975 [Candidatus Pacearchaeota archaeon]
MKKGEMSVGMIVAIIIVIVTIVIIALTYYQLIKTEDLDRETCKTSAVLRGTIPDSILESQAKDLVQLKCKTKKICVTTNRWPLKGECQKDFGSLEGKYSTYRISKDKEKAEKQIKTLLAREMADCWDMLGRGAYAIFKREITVKKSVGSVGIICSRIKFDETVTEKDNNPQLKELEGFNDYLLRYKHPQMNVSYWDFLRNSYDGETMNILFGQSVSGSGSTSSGNPQSSELISDFLNTKINLTTTQAIMYVEARPTAMGALIGASVGGIVGGLLGFKAGHPFAGAMIGGVAGWGAGDWIHLKSLKVEGMFPEAEYAAGVFLLDYTSEGFKKFNEKGEFYIASLG